MLMGEYIHSMDSKGRIIIPAKFRKELGEDFVATRGLDDCLFVYPMDEWEILEKKLKSLPLTRKDARAFVRFFFSGATECQLDKQGRISIPTNLREFGDLQKEVVIIGVSNRVELWSKERWDGYLSDAEDSYEDIAETIEELGI
ncbi:MULTISPECIES: division/cell wall cluster transcriptional repressor MraZ [unclassified Candidatus Frackibacter]|uniref:division/cell wall cluster transcriptional repressor MraZ n=1 Tax=unclassified Candidatus Frackibacter TaxID=2648818 RepID=UPI0008904F7B|nr:MULTISPECIES: division/cell wall cluster transcriptional repressor MraZ [unclassified Candidatus Frackibacter]SDC35296.1 MraZ protein [Candidatus Frackibacter sp. WG11]SEM56116.1 MraZ protein [Candidatus Frackibacter sp. WG12]SFL71186.1 MraZ protein [Candidatus Frackibacter sp. WG13]